MYLGTTLGQYYSCISLTSLGQGAVAYGQEEKEPGEGFSREHVLPGAILDDHVIVA